MSSPAKDISDGELSRIFRRMIFKEFENLWDYPGRQQIVQLWIQDPQGKDMITQENRIHFINI